ncbi:hypothetical protein [Streptomyces clavuligerus]|uniref:Uncharacterized protein n=1 Tax=Streptomyces clavuligerus TaxID=1901 RepID=B5GLP6_STRCL|nr:hypothetical protein [Streptomyces clavuligerus]EDY47242.1 hypothetical protein SSCG_00270 [Streptomyces clavuligerus]EFG04907.1 Hypothetical protein SCLAV_p1425 [Streptomyces clavuligerus]MBY6306654.1 hypothetical protein [Streptomyces clavuligerus]QCS10739.1 hypothetical protein CRV15_35045 [Streptomyces clavuligerus]QPJ97225.1 hypothetical protein GE265_29435 [Streptomyces clavuligerus]
MSSSCDPGCAPAGDVSAALMNTDSRLREIHAGRPGEGPEQRMLTEQFMASLGPGEADALLDGTCTLIFLFMKWLREAHEDQDEDVLAHVVPSVVAMMRAMPRSVRPEAIPTMSGLLVASAMGLSPGLWRKQYGYWTKEEMTPLEVTAVLLAEHINRLAGDPDYATRIIIDALSDDGDEEDSED